MRARGYGSEGAVGTGKQKNKGILKTFRRQISYLFVKNRKADYKLENIILWELFVFSDDMEWCRDNRESMGFQNFRTVHFVDGNVKGRNYIDMQLMSQCEAMIMSKSAFCYLAALLNTRRKFAVNPTARDV